MTSAPIEIKRIHGFGYNADTVRSWIHAEGPLARNSWFGYKCVVGPGGVPPYCDSNDLLCPAGVNARIEPQKHFPELSNTRQRGVVPFDPPKAKQRERAATHGGKNVRGRA